MTDNWIFAWCHHCLTFTHWNTRGPYRYCDNCGVERGHE